MARNGAGTKFTIDRKLFSSDIWFASPWKLKIWIYLLGNANHKDSEFMGVKIKRGQLIRSLRRIRKDNGYKIGYRMKYPSLSTVHTVCEDLTKEGRIEQRSERCGILFTICNYNKLQPVKKREANNEANGSRTPSEHNNNDINKNDKEHGSWVLEDEIYYYYLKTIKPLKSKRERARINIRSHLRRYNKDALIAAANNYAKEVDFKKHARFRYRVQNFYGVNENPFIDYLPENFGPSDDPLSEDPNYQVQGLSREQINQMTGVE